MHGQRTKAGWRAIGACARAIALGAFAFAALLAQAGPPAGTPIPNQATSTGQRGVTPITNASNIVVTNVGALPGGAYSAVLSASTVVNSQPGATVLIPHTLTNTGTFPDSYTIAIADRNLQYSFSSVALYLDANNDGQPDSAVPLANPVALTPGQVFHFVAKLVVPATAPVSAQDDATVSVASAGGATVSPNIDRVSLADTSVPRDCASATKNISRSSGPSPAGPITITITYTSCDKARSKLVITDKLPVGMRYVPNSAHWSGTGTATLSDGVVGNDREGSGSSQVAYDYNVTQPGTVTAQVFGIPANNGGMVSFDVQIDSGLAVGTIVTNGANYVFYDTNGNYQGSNPTNTVDYRVTGKLDFDLLGEKLPTATPGATITFTNVLTNRGDLPDTYDITLSGSTFPAGTTFALFQSDGVTPLADTDGSGTPDTGVVAPGTSYKIVVRARIPETAAPGAYKVTKTARSAAVPTRTASADDSVDTLATRCRVVLDPDNQAQIGRGQHVTYTHFITNHGNCDETVMAMIGYIGNSLPGWRADVYVDNAVAGGGSIPGLLDPTDTPVPQGWSTMVRAGQSLRILVDVHAPDDTQPTGAKAAKAIIASNITTLIITGSATGALTVHDTTVIDDKDDTPAFDNSIRNFTDPTYATPTVWGVIGRPLYLRANATSCNSLPDVVDTRTVVITGPNGEQETLTATETGPNTGIFSIPPLAVRLPPVTANDNVLEGRPNDVFLVDLQGCGRTISTVVTLMSPAGVVFDSRTNDPIAGAIVTLEPASGGQCSTSAVTLSGSANPATTGDDGRFTFTGLATGDYCLAVKAPNGYAFPSKVQWTQLPQGHVLDTAGATTGGSYGQAFHVAADFGAVAIDLPLDAAAQSGLFVQKEASKTSVELGEFVDYSVHVRNSTGNRLDRAEVILADSLPAGFAYVAGTARRDGAHLDDPKGGKGPALALDVGTLDRGIEIVVTYRVRVGPGAMQGDGTNRVQATYTANGQTTTSNVATAKVQVTGGVFSDKGFILGKMFLDCNANGVQDKGEVGVPGVRIFLEDGTYIITDGDGRFSFYGIGNRTHVAKVDRTTLPPGAKLEVISARNLGDAGSRIVDLKAAELARADFAIAGCEAPVLENVKARTEKAAKQDELAAMVGAQLATETRVITDVKALPASGVVAAPTQLAIPGGPQPAPGSPFQSVAPTLADQRPSPAPRLAPQTAAPVLVPLEKLVPDLDKELGFIGLTDGQTVAYAQTSVRVKGTAGATFKLVVNGIEVSEKRVGKRSSLAEKQVQAWEYIGIDLKPGENTLAVTQVDQFGNARGTVSIKVIAPGALAKVLIELPQGGGIADGKTAAKVVVRLVDEHGVPVTVRTPLTLEASRGKWRLDDLDPTTPGVQTFVEAGRGEFLLVPPAEPGESRIAVSAGSQKAEARLDFLPELRSMVATGVIEGVINARNLNTRALVPTRASDGFEQELQHLTRDWNNGRTEAGVRAAFYLKGKIKGEYLLTAAYDSEKDTQERLFRDIQPDEFYPIYGDSAVRGFDAQSTSHLYVRVDHNRSYLLWGDFTTTSTGETRKLSNYNRSLTGVKEHFENSRVSANVFATRDSSRQVIDELRANGTSGPFQLTQPNMLDGSEKVEIITRDRNQPSLIVATVPLTRLTDYEIEVLTGRVLFKAPVASVDSNLNPISIRITYEADQGGEHFWVAGIDAQVKLNDRVEVGGVYVKDKNPLQPFTLAGANMTVKVGEGTYVISEVAKTEAGLDEHKGNAGRIEVKHESANLKAQAFVAKTDVGFDNPGAYLTQGRSESGGKLEYKLSKVTTIRAEALRSEDVANNAVRDGMSLTVEHQIADRLTLQVGVRHAADKGSTSAIPPVDGQPTPQPMPDDVTSVRARLTGAVPHVEGAQIYGEAEVDVHDVSRKILALGGEYQLPNKGRLYARHEFISSITGPYGLNPTERQNTSAVGIDTEYMKDGRLFSEYRIRDAMSGGDVEAALGLKNLWNIAPGLKMGTTFERVHAFSGTGQNENTAVALAFEYTGSERWKGSTRIEVRDGQTQDSLLYTVGLAARLNRDWTALARNAYSIQRNKGEQTGEHVIERMQAGLAWRDTETNKWNLLGRIEHKLESDDTQQPITLKSSTQILSLHADWQPRRPFLFSGRYAAKWTTDNSNGLSTRYHAQVIGARATWEFAPKWDAGIVSSVMFGGTTASRQYGVGLEVGYLVATNLWVSAGYNFAGYKDADLAGADYTVKGPYVRLRYKFDETTIEGALPLGDKNKAAGEASK